MSSDLIRGVLKMLGMEAARRAKLFLSGPKKGMSSAFEKFLKDTTSPVVEIAVARKPINSTIRKLLNWLSLGKLEKNMHKLGYDELYHNFLLITTADGKMYRIERNEVVENVPIKKGDLQREMYKFEITKKGVMISDLIKPFVEDKDFWVYSGSTNNCQAFTKSIVEKGIENGYIELPDEETMNILNENQPINEILTPFTSVVSDVVTDVVGAARRVTDGSGFGDSIFDAISDALGGRKPPPPPPTYENKQGQYFDSRLRGHGVVSIGDNKNISSLTKEELETLQRVLGGVPRAISGRGIRVEDLGLDHSKYVIPQITPAQVEILKSYLKTK